MTTTAQNNQSYAMGGISVPYPVSTGGSFDINQGDLCYYDTSGHLLKTVDSDAHAAFLAGVATESSFLNLYGTKTYTDSGTIQVFTQGIFNFKTTNGDTYNHGDACYIGADAQTITNTDPGAGHKIGYIWFRPGQTATAGGSGVTIDMLVTPLFPITGGL